MRAVNRDRRAEDCAPYLRAHAQLNCDADAIENHKMKTRCFDHIDLRVTNMETAEKFYGKNFCRSLGSFTKVRATIITRSMLAVANGRWNFSV